MIGGDTMCENNNTPKVCSTCGTTLVEVTLDGSFSLDGSQDLSAFKCPNCSKDSE